MPDNRNLIADAIIMSLALDGTTDELEWALGLADDICAISLADGAGGHYTINPYA